MQTFTLTLEQVKDIFRAGCRQGEDEAVAYEWGSRSRSSRADALEEALYDVLKPEGATLGDCSALLTELALLDLSC